MEAVAALQVTAAATVPLHFVEDASDGAELKSTQYLKRWRTEDRFDSELEGELWHVPLE